MKLSDISTIKHLEFDIANRKLIVFHIGEIEKIEKSIKELNTKIEELEIANSTISNNTVLTISEDEDKNLWLGTHASKISIASS